jgi:hypothetical protein
MSEVVLSLKGVRLSFQSLFDTDQYDRYSATFIIDPVKNADVVKQLDAEIMRVATEKWGEKTKNILAKAHADDAVAFVKSDKLNKDGDVYGGFEDMFWLAANNKTQPTIVDLDRTPLTRASGRPYNGCYVVARVSIWAQDNKWGRRVNAELKGVQFYRDGDAFTGGRPADPDDFEDLSDGADDEALA